MLCVLTIRHVTFAENKYDDDDGDDDDEDDDDDDGDDM